MAVKAGQLTASTPLAIKKNLYSVMKRFAGFYHSPASEGFTEAAKKHRGSGRSQTRRTSITKRSKNYDQDTLRCGALVFEHCSL